MPTDTVSKDVYIAKEFVQGLKKKLGNKLKRAIFFGSRAKGTALPNSDYDVILVLSDRDQGIMDQVYDDALDILLDKGIDISVKVYTEKNFERKMRLMTPFMSEIKRTGIDL